MMADENKGTELSKKQKKKALQQAAETMLNELSVYYPNCFNCNAPKPLKLFIRNEILSDHPELDKVILREAMQQYCNTNAYFLASVEKAVQRINLAGEAVAELTKKERDYCEMKLTQLAKKAEKQRQKEHNIKENEARRQKNIEIKANKAKKRAEEQAKKAEAKEKAKQAAKEKPVKVKQPVKKEDKEKPVVVKKKQPANKADKSPPVIVKKKQPETVIKPKRRPTLSLRR